MANTSSLGAVLRRVRTCMGETAAAGGVFMGLGLRGVRGSGAGGTGTVGGSAVPLEAGPAAEPEEGGGARVTAARIQVEIKHTLFRKADTRWTKSLVYNLQITSSAPP